MCVARDGKCSRVAHQADQLLLGLAAGDLPGVGPATKDKLDALGVARVADVRARSKQALQRELGTKTGASVRDPVPCSHLLPIMYTWTFCISLKLGGLVCAAGPCDLCLSKADMPWLECCLWATLSPVVVCCIVYALSARSVLSKGIVKTAVYKHDFYKERLHIPLSECVRQ